MSHNLSKLVEIMALLRSDRGCPWDREQTHETLKKYLLEETYELLDAIDSHDDDALKEELGDVLLQIVFHSQIAAESDRFTIDDVIETIVAKLIRRHPHVFGDADLKTTADVLTRWEQIKQSERVADGKEARKSILDGIPNHMPALMYAWEVQRRAARVGFDWPDGSGPLEKIAEEAAEIAQAMESGDEKHVEAEWGDLLFSLVNAARHAGINPEEALRQAAKKFEDRFRYIEKQAAQTSGLDNMSLEQMDVLWEKAKKISDHRPGE